MVTRNGWLLTVAASIALMGACPMPAAAQDVIFIVRHAEKDTSNPQDRDPPLTAEGRARADALRDMLKDAGVTTIITSPALRTQATAEPLATALGVTPRTDPMRDAAALVAIIRSLPAGGGNVLVVGHSNTIPELLRAMGHATPVVIDEAEYDNLFVVSPGEPNRPRVTRLRYRR